MAANTTLASRLADPQAQDAVPETERRPVPPIQGHAQILILARGNVQQVHDRRDDLTPDERVVIVEWTAVARAQTSLCGVGQCQRGGASGAPP